MEGSIGNWLKVAFDRDGLVSLAVEGEGGRGGGLAGFAADPKRRLQWRSLFLAGITLLSLEIILGLLEGGNLQESLAETSGEAMGPADPAWSLGSWFNEFKPVAECAVWTGFLRQVARGGGCSKGWSPGGLRSGPSTRGARVGRWCFHHLLRAGCRPDQSSPASSGYRRILNREARAWRKEGEALASRWGGLPGTLG